jgi:hypothetical protein
MIINLMYLLVAVQRLVGMPLFTLANYLVVVLVLPFTGMYAE